MSTKTKKLIEYEADENDEMEISIRRVIRAPQSKCSEAVEYRIIDPIGEPVAAIRYDLVHELCDEYKADYNRTSAVLRKYFERVAHPIASGEQDRASDEEIAEWNDRHALGLSLATDARCAFEDAQSLKAKQPVVQPIGEAEPNEYCDVGEYGIWTIGINVKEWGRKIACHGKTKEEAINLRDQILATSHVPFNSSAECNPFVTQCPRCNNPWNACDKHLHPITDGSGREDVETIKELLSYISLLADKISFINLPQRVVQEILTAINKAKEIELLHNVYLVPPQSDAQS